MLHLKFDASVKSHFKSLNILTVYGQYIFETISLVRETNIRKEPVKLHQYNTRHKNDIITSHHNLELFKKKPTYTGTQFMKRLPADLQNEASIKTFKRKT